VFQECVAVGAVGKGRVQHAGVFLCLLHPATQGVVVVLGLHDSEWKVVMVQHIVGELALSARRDPTARMDLPVRDVDLLTDLARLPSRALDGGGEVAGADFLFGQAFFAHGSFVPSGRVRRMPVRMGLSLAPRPMRLLFCPRRYSIMVGGNAQGPDGWAVEPGSGLGLCWLASWEWGAVRDWCTPDRFFRNCHV